MFCGGIFAGAHRKNVLIHQMQMKVDSAGTTATFSKSTDTTLTLNKTHLSKNGKTAYIPITFNSFDSVGIKADDYRLAVKPTDMKPMAYRLTGRLVLFQSANRGVIVITADKKIENEPLSIAILNTTSVAKGTTTDDGDVDDVESDTGDSGDIDWGKHDGLMFICNPGTTEAQAHTRLDAAPTDAKALYQQIFNSDDKQTIERKIKANQQKIRQNRAAAQALRERLSASGYDVPKNPAWIRDDWRPYDAVNLKTGRTANGKDVNTYVADSEETDQNDDTENYPQNLKGRHGKTTEDDNSTNGDSNADSSNGPAQQWTDLQDAWTAILEEKRDIYVTQYSNLYITKKSLQDVLDNATVGQSKYFKQLSKVEE